MVCVNSTELEIIKLDQCIDFTALHRVNPQRYPFILESSAQAKDILSENISSSNQDQNKNARYDILFAFPLESITLHSDNKLSGNVIDAKKDFLSNLDLNILNSKINKDSNCTSSLPFPLPFTGGWFVYLSYELAAQIESRLELPLSEKLSITAKLTRIPVAIVYDKQTGIQSIIAEREYKDKIALILEDIKSCMNNELSSEKNDIELIEEISERYIESIKKIKNYIKEGDVFQVNLSRLWKTDKINSLDSINLYQSLKKSNPAPFSAYVSFDGLKIISSSPERLVKVKDGKVQTRPIAGTRARKNETSADIESLKELIAHPKERAEHIMLIDLERNDLGRICVPGSIHVDELMTLESFQHVHHIVSNVSGDLKEGKTPGDVIRAVFPGGTITGCPKERCMQIISELEAMPRGAYTGSLGYINHDGSMDLNILIRTFELSDNQLSLRAGAGLVADSIAENELQETRTKAKGLLEALV